MADVKQITKEFVNPISWIRIAFAVLILFGIYKYMTRPTQNITAKPGSNVNITTINKAQRFLIPFIEVYIDQRSNAELGTGIKGGARIEF
jgi:hypothetical protein